MEYSFKNVNLIPYNANFELDEESIKFLTLLDLNLTEFKNKIKPDIKYNFKFLQITSETDAEYYDMAFTSLLNNLLIQAVKNRTEYTIIADLYQKLDSKLFDFSRGIKERKDEYLSKLKQDISNEVFFYGTFKPVGIISDDISSFNGIINNYVHSLRDLLIFNTTN